MPETIHTPNAPAAVGPYSQAVKVGDFVFTAGQIGMDPETGQMTGTDIASQTRQALRNLRAILEAAGSSMTGVVKTTIFVDDMDDFATVNAVYSEFLSDAGVQTPPARSTVEVAALPLGALVEIEAVAALDN